MNNKRGFSLVEIMVAVLIGLIVIEAAYLFFPIGKRISREGEALNEITQDARIVLNRMKREIRQSPVIISNIPEERENGIEIIEFENGFVEEGNPEPQYIRYQKNNQTIQRLIYYFTDPDDQETIVDYSFPNAVEQVENTEIVAENITNLKIYSDNNLIKLFLRLEKQNENLELLTGVYPRNSQL